MSGVSEDKPNPMDPIPETGPERVSGSVEDQFQDIEELEPVGSSTDNPVPMTRDELKTHLEATEAEVEKMTSRVEEKISAMDERMDARLNQVDEVDQKMEERGEKIYAQIEKSLSDMRADRQEELGNIRQSIGELAGDMEAVKTSNDASFRNNRILVGVAIFIVAAIQLVIGLLT
jgi:DNA anti-recombination protein RmuC